MFGRRQSFVPENIANLATGVRPPELPKDKSMVPSKDRETHISPQVQGYVDEIHAAVIEAVDMSKLIVLPINDRADRLTDVIIEILEEKRVSLTKHDQTELVGIVLDELLGFGPLECLLDDPEITDILANGPDNIWIEKGGKLIQSKVRFKNQDHMMNIITRIVTSIGRRINQTVPLVDARLPCGARFNAVIPPLCPMPSISIRKFPAKKFDLKDLVEKDMLSQNMATFLAMAVRFRMNILVSGGTGSGKTTTLRALAKCIDHGERIVTIEDTLELALEHPNIVPMEARPANLEGDGAITLQHLLINSLRMRPDRVIVGEVRGMEAGEMLQAMNTGHDGSLGTIHANNARDALMRFENIICMDPKYKPGHATQKQIASALDIVIQVSRMSDGSRRIVSIDEIAGLEGETVVMRPLFKFKILKESSDGRITGTYDAQGMKPQFMDRFRGYSLYDNEKRLIADMLTPVI